MHAFLDFAVGTGEIKHVFALHVSIFIVRLPACLRCLPIGVISPPQYSHMKIIRSSAVIMVFEGSEERNTQTTS